VYDVGHDGGMQFLATEFIDGVTLRSVVERGRLDARQALTIACRLPRPSPPRMTRASSTVT
jgi:hypothetical protein